MKIRLSGSRNSWRYWNSSGNRSSPSMSGLTPCRPSFQCSTDHQTRDGLLRQAEDSSPYTAEERTALIDLIKARMGVIDNQASRPNSLLRSLNQKRRAFCGPSQASRHALGGILRPVSCASLPTAGRGWLAPGPCPNRKRWLTSLHRFPCRDRRRVSP